MKIEQENFDKAGRFYVPHPNSLPDGEETLAEMDYEMHGKILLITHTEVSETLEGKGVGKQLVSASVDYARQHNLVIKATCSFAKAVLDKTPEFSDVYHAKNTG